jgi:hypothetical protein
MGVLLRRSLVRADQLIASLLLVAVGTGALAALLAGLAAGIDTGVATVLRGTEPTAGALRIDTALDPDPAGQDESFRAGIAEAIGDAPLHVVYGIRSEPLTAEIDGDPTPVQLGAQEGVDQLAELVSGKWPTGDDEASLPEAAAASLGVVVGDTVAVAGRSYTIAAIWRAHDAAAPVWFSETAIASGRLGDAVGPLLVDQATLATLTPRAAVTWTIVPDDTVGTADLAALVPLEARVRAAAERLGTGRYAVTASGGLSDSAQRVEGAVATARGLGGVAIVILIATTGIALGLVARSLAQVRSAETQLIEARGSSGGRLALWGVAEAVVVAVLGSALGVGAAAALGAAGVTASPGAETLLLAGIMGAVGGAAIAAFAARTTGSRGRTPSSRSRRARPVAETESIGPALIATLLAGIALAASTTGSAAAGPVSLVAPALALVAGVLLVRLLVAPATRLAELVAARRPGLLPVLPLRQLGRRPRAVASAFLIVALAAGAVVFAGLAAGAEQRADDAAVASRVGADVRILFSGTDRDPASADAYAGIDSIDAAAGVTVLDGKLGGLPATLLLVPDGFAEVVPEAPAVPTAVSGAPGAILTPQLAAGLGASEGDVLTIALGILREPVILTVAGVSALPGTGPFGVMMGSEPFAAVVPDDAAPPVSEVWLAAADADAAADAARAATTRPARFLTADGVSDAPIADVGTTAAALAAGVVVLVAWAGFAAAAIAFGRLRRDELLPLRSMGVSPRSQGRARALELAVTGAAAVVAGALVGALATRLAVAGPLVLDALFAPVSLVLIGGGVVVVASVALLAGAAVRRTAASSGGGAG